MQPNLSFVEDLPFNKFLKIEIGPATATSVEISLPLRPELLNHVGTLHAAAQFGLGEAAAGALVGLIFSDLITEVVPLNAKSTIEYRRPGYGKLTARGTFTPEERQRIVAEYQEKGKARFTTVAELTDEHGVAATTVTVEWVVLKKPSN